jgi:hypothetical protein
VRAAAVGLDPWRVPERSAHPDEHALTEAIVSQLEVNAVAKLEAQANATAYRTVEGILGVLEVLGFVERKG